MEARNTKKILPLGRGNAGLVVCMMNVVLRLPVSSTTRQAYRKPTRVFSKPKEKRCVASTACGKSSIFDYRVADSCNGMSLHGVQSLDQNPCREFFITHVIHTRPFHSVPADLPQPCPQDHDGTPDARRLTSASS